MSGLFIVGGGGAGQEILLTHLHLNYLRILLWITLQLQDTEDTPNCIKNPLSLKFDVFFLSS
jgi:hypothetical protein